MVLDTNVLVRSALRRSAASPNRRIVRMWLEEKRLQLIVSVPLLEEYLKVFAQIVRLDAKGLAWWRARFELDTRCTLVNLGRRYTESRDPDDNLLLATATAGRAEYLITNDRDLLELPDKFQRSLPYEIVTPRDFLAAKED